jgi:hypothetical protein
VTAPQLQAARAAAPSLAARARAVLTSEWTKIRSVRSNYWTLLIAAVATLGSTAVVAQTIASTPPSAPGNPFTPLTASFAGYAEYAVLPVSVLGVLTFSSEYATGLICTTFAAVPRRRAVLAARAAVAGTVALIAGELLAFAAFFLTQAILSGRHGGLSLLHPGVPRAVLAAGFLLPACVIVSLALGAIVRHTAGAVAAAVGVIYLLALLCLFLPSPWNDRIGRFTLALAAYQLVALHPQPDLFAPGWSLLVLIAWPVAAILTAAILITRRDT